MKVFGITVSLLLAASNCSAFAPSSIAATATTTTTTSQLHAKSLEGWKIDGTIKPVNNFILVKKAEELKKTDTGILLTEGSKIVKTEGTVVEVGPGKLHPDSGIPFPMPVSPGDGLIYGKYDGTELDIDGVRHSLIRDTDILVKFNGDETLTEENVDVPNDSVLIHVNMDQSQTSGGLLLATTTTQNRPSTGTVVKVGPGRMQANGDLMPMNVDVGDEVKFMDFAGNEVKIGDKEYSVVTMPEILAKF